MRRTLGLLLVMLAIAHPVRAQDFIICKKCLDPAVSDTSSSPGIEAQGSRAAFVNARLMLVFVGVDHRARFAQWTAAGWSIESVDGVTRAAGLAMGFDDTNLPIVSYHDSTGGVVVARRIGAGWNVQTIFPGLGVTGPTSLAHIPGVTGIACVNSLSHELLYLQQIGNGPWTIESVSSLLPGAGDPSLVLEPGARAIAFRDGVQGVLRLATSGDSPPWQVQLVDGTPGTGSWASLVGHAGDYGIAYHDGPDHQLRYAHPNPGGWAIDIVDGLGARKAGPACVAVEFGNDAAGPVGIAYYDAGASDLDFAGTVSPGWNHTSLYSLGDVGNTLASCHEVGGPVEMMSIVYSTSDGDLQYYERPAAVLSVAPSAEPRALQATWRRDAAHAGGTVRFVSPRSGPARVTILDAQGRRVAEPLACEIAAGPAEVPWDGRDTAGQAVAAGVYFALVRVAGATAGARGIVLH